MPSTPPPPPFRDPSRFESSAPVTAEITVGDLSVDGTLPRALSGRDLRIGPNPVAGPDASSRGCTDGMVHAVALHDGRARSYRNRWVRTHTRSAELGAEQVPGPTSTASEGAPVNVFVFGGRILAVADGALAYELATNLDTVCRVDLAGQTRGVGARPKLDPLTGELHLISSPGTATALHHVISAGGMTRRTRAIAGAHAPILDLAITRDHLLLFADGCTGITDHNRDSKITWLSGGMTRHGQVVDAYDDDDSVVVSVADEGLEQWTVTPTANVVRRRRVDGTPQPFVRINEEFAGSPHQYLYGVGGDDATAFGGTTLYKHDAVAGTREDRDFGEGRQAGEFLFVVDPDRNFDEDGGWLLGLVHDETTTTTSLVVLDAADVTGPVVASVRLPRRLPSGLRGLWLPSPT